MEPGKKKKKPSKLEIERRIIEEVAKRPLLYVISHPDYKDKNKKENAFQKIAEILGEFTGSDVLTKWTGLRNQYLAYLRRLKLPTGTGRTAAPYFRHAKLMMFCKENPLPENTPTSNMELEFVYDEEGNIIQLEQPPEGSQIILSEEDVQQELQNLETAEAQNPEAPEGQNLLTPQPRPHTSADSRQKKRQMDDFEKNLIGLLKTSQDEDANDDEFDNFCKSLAPKLRRISTINAKKASQIHFQINQLIFEAEQELL